MKVQRVRIPDTDRVTWLVLDDNYLSIQPIQSYLQYLESIERSPNTVHAYAGHLKLFWEFLRDSKIDWKDISLEKLADFIHWLRSPEPKVISIQTQEAKRTERTVNTILSAVCNFYDFHYRMGNVEELKVYGQQFYSGSRSYKPFLHHITKGKPVKKSLIKLKEPRIPPEILTGKQVRELISACNCRRDKFLISLLYESGMRIGQALGLRHEDVRSWDNEIYIVPRTNNVNGVRAKSKNSYVVHVSKELMTLYSDYLIYEYPEDLESDYVFINIWEGETGNALTYSSVAALFRRLEKKTGIKTSPHIFRHTHATELIRQGWDMAHVQKRLGHASVQTTINTYTHLTDNDLKEAYQEYLQQRDK
ncbi:tyrosine-type recombinase/integrase [Calothrix sp. NIES-2098]|uniref:tyrosine-type recombinase/integrase n=1 Tax=Calothrix sp. NIES-2098 TaxID=1954171 RepID=UPI000B5F86C8|nr:integrase family protein [Calothrix sp. NIES-2098]